MKIMFCSLGCDKNLVDSEKMIRLLLDEGHTLTDDEHEADVIIVNTCCFIGDAKQESIQTIIDMGRMKQEGRCKALLVTGCLATRYAEDIRRDLPEVDGLLSVNSVMRIGELLKEVLSKDPVTVPYISAPDPTSYSRARRSLTTGGYYAYLKIAEGCDRKCTYCVIPKIRGHYRSFPMEDLIEEAKDLVASGVRELILVAQDTTLYGTDLYREPMLPTLLEKLSEIEDLKWIRLLYCYPESITDAMIDAMKRLPKVCHYIDMPIQHASDAILKKMGRHTDREHILRVIAHLREEIPDIALRTTLIAGFPGETDEQFEEMKEFIDMVSFDRLGVFPYSAEEDTPAAEMEGQCPEEIKRMRADSLMELQQEISADLCSEHIGQEFDVLVEGFIPEEGMFAGRTYMDAPGVDGLVFFASPDHEWMSGDIVRVRITGAYEYDLTGELINELTQ
ncbi:MAG: 30S ribosomal protein S12 methylthiotransferase RimO [Lachnospiraceae bacterium]|nr:30S ribosomal protein S12 methylthiotransferase RimO [Lachnospiraceae bacterium]